MQGFKKTRLGCLGRLNRGLSGWGEAQPEEAAILAVCLDGEKSPSHQRINGLGNIGFRDAARFSNIPGCIKAGVVRQKKQD